MAVTAAFDMYSKCCDGLLDPDWKVEMKVRMSNSSWRLLASEQMLKYKPVKNRYAGDKTFRAFIKRPKRMREDERRSVASGENKTKYKPNGLTLDNFKRTKRSTWLSPPRLCGDLEDLRGHFATMKRSTITGTCKVCNKKTLWKCELCDKRMCALTKGQFKGALCALQFHDDALFGLTKSDDRALSGRKAGKKCLPPNASKIKSNKAKVEVIKRKIAEETEVINIVLKMIMFVQRFLVLFVHDLHLFKQQKRMDYHVNKHVKLLQCCCTKQTFDLLQRSNQIPLVGRSSKGLNQES